MSDLTLLALVDFFKIHQFFLCRMKSHDDTTIRSQDAIGIQVKTKCSFYNLGEVVSLL